MEKQAMNRNNQLGAIGTFVVVGAVLAAAALAVLYSAHRSANDQQNPPISSELVAADNKSDDKDGRDSKDTKTESKTGATDQKSETHKSQNTDSKSGDKTSEAATGSDTKTESKSEEVKTDTQAVPQTPEVQTDDKNLPKTGPAESLAAVLAAGGLAFIVLAYIRSRRVV